MPNFSTEQAFAIKVCMGLAVGGWLMLWAALQNNPFRPRAWLDIYLVTILGGIVGARIFHVLIHFEAFFDAPLNIPRLWFAELAWQGAAIGGGLAFWGMCRWRKAEISRAADGLALAMPVVFMAICWAARSAGLILGRDVANLDDLPVWAAAFLPDLGRDVAPRYELQMLGVVLGAVMLLVVTGLTLMNRLTGRRLWVSLALLGVAVVILDVYSARSGPQLWGLPLDQLCGGLLTLASIGTITSSKRSPSTAYAPAQDTL